MKKNIQAIYQTFVVTLVSLLILIGANQSVTAQENIKTIVVLPFKVNAAQNLSPVREGIHHMLYSRLSWKDNVVVIPANKLKEHLSDTKDIPTASEIAEIARLTHCDFVLTGAITRLGDSFSIDVQVYDIRNQRYMAFFEQSQKKDDLVHKVNKIAALINKKIFDRTTMAWENMEQEKQAYLKKQKRKNPEYMLKNPRWQDKEQSPGWKIWKYLF